MDVESTPLKHDHQQHCCVDHPEDDDLFRAKRTTTKTLATRTIVGVVVCVAAIVGVTYMLTSTPLIDSHAAAPGAAGGLLLLEGDSDPPKCVPCFDGSVPCCSLQVGHGLAWDYDCPGCSYHCAANYGSRKPCCGQGGGRVDPQWQCPKSLPTCVNYVYNNHYGVCRK